ncbi:hypothetical protein [Parabacteroides chongii]|uniref:hypothetical protein n=1 Tax=Parabacteroides chongii TaxID=2685834 RepID=UPI00240CF323|nr:hypothetical protein [Parabacteroides chongii]WFE85954.1 hypothetical protein P3L47_04960 [Parabacteroides chongii]
MILKGDDILLVYVYKHFGNNQAALRMDEDGETILLNAYFPLGFAYWYEDILRTIPFKREDYDKHKPLQELLTELDLNKESFWGLTLYLYDFITDACKNLLSPQKNHRDIYNEFVAFMRENHSEVNSITFETASKKKITLTDPLLLDVLRMEFELQNFTSKQQAEFEKEYHTLSAAEKADSRRKTSYFFAHHLSLFLQIDGISNVKRRDKAQISNKEKELILCLLYVCKFSDNPENYLDLGYYNKLMKDFKDQSMNMSNKYGLEISLDWRFPE